jgi:hypothetical protein
LKEVDEKTVTGALCYILPLLGRVVVSYDRSGCWKSDGRALEKQWKCMKVRGRAVGMHEEVMGSEERSCGKSVGGHRDEDVRDVRDVPRIFTNLKLWISGMFENGARQHRVVGIIPERREPRSIDLGDAPRLVGDRGGSQLKPTRL